MIRDGIVGVVSMRHCSWIDEAFILCPPTYWPCSPVQTEEIKSSRSRHCMPFAKLKEHPRNLIREMDMKDTLTFEWFFGLNFFGSNGIMPLCHGTVFLG